MKRIYCTFLLSVMFSLVTNAQEVTMDLLKSSSWLWKRLDLRYAFSADSIYRVYNSVCYGTMSQPFYLSSEPHSRFRDELVGKNKKGNYVVVKDAKTSGAYNYKITSTSNTGITLYSKEVTSGYNEMILSKNDSEKYDTLLLSSSYKELSYKHGKQYQQAYFNRFPSTWYDFERTFNGAFFKKEMEAIYKQDFSHEYKKYLDAFSNLKDIDTKEYYRKLIDVTIGMPIQSTPASDMWQKIVAAKVARNKNLVSLLLKEKTELQQARFWQFVQKDNEHLKKGRVVSEKHSCIKEVWRYGMSIDKECIYFTDSLCYIIKNCVPTRTPEIIIIAPYQMSDSGNKVDGAIAFSHVQVGEHTKLQMHLPANDGKFPTYYKKEPSLVTDTLLMATTYRCIFRQSQALEIHERPFFDAFPSTWSEFYAVMISDEYGNNGFRDNADRYIYTFKHLSCIPVREKLRKMVGISIGAMAQDPTSELWRTVVCDLSTRYKEELNSVLQEFESWQQTSFRQFVENKE